MCLIFSTLPLTCHHLTGSNFPFSETSAVHLTAFRKPDLLPLKAEDGVKGHWVRVQAKFALVLVCRTLFRGLRLVSWRFVTRHLLCCHQGHPCRT